jgi:hypothetical protein
VMVPWPIVKEFPRFFRVMVPWPMVEGVTVVVGEVWRSARVMVP